MTTDRRPKGKWFLSLRDTPRFPAALWEQFRETARRRGEPWIDALRRIVTRYVQEHDEDTRHDDTPEN